MRLFGSFRFTIYLRLIFRYYHSILFRVCVYGWAECLWARFQALAGIVDDKFIEHGVNLSLFLSFSLRIALFVRSLARSFLFSLLSFVSKVVRCVHDECVPAKFLWSTVAPLNSMVDFANWKTQIKQTKHV